MKVFLKIQLLLAVMLFSVTGSAQVYKANNGVVIANTKVFTMVYPIDKVLWSDDPSVKIRRQPNVKSEAVGDIYFFEGLPTAVLLAEKSDKWVRVGDHKTIGYSNSNYLQMRKWYTGKGDYYLVADGLAPIYVESMADATDEVQYNYTNALCYVKSGTLIADTFRETDKYYILETVHTGLIIPKMSVKKVRRR